MKHEPYTGVPGIPFAIAKFRGSIPENIRLYRSYVNALQPIYDALFSHDYCNKLPQALWLKITERYPPQS